MGRALETGKLKPASEAFPLHAERQARPLTALEMAASVAAMTLGAGLVGYGWAVPHLGAVAFGVLLVVATPLGMLHVQGASPLDRQVADDL